MTFQFMPNFKMAAEILKIQNLKNIFCENAKKCITFQDISNLPNCEILQSHPCLPPSINAGDTKSNQPK